MAELGFEPRTLVRLWPNEITDGKEMSKLQAGGQALGTGVASSQRWKLGRTAGALRLRLPSVRAECVLCVLTRVYDLQLFLLHSLPVARLDWSPRCT